jgi:hypothetical protein
MFSIARRTLRPRRAAPYARPPRPRPPQDAPPGRRFALACLTLLGTWLIAACDAGEEPPQDVPPGALIAIAGAMLDDVPEARAPRVNLLRLPAGDSLRIPRALREELARRGVPTWSPRPSATLDTSLAILSFGPGHAADDGYDVFADWFVPLPDGAYSDGYVYHVRCGARRCVVTDRRALPRSVYGAPAERGSAGRDDG